ncbi:MAG: helix-turn-helix domain-containing protein, partial [Clostridia bacterium]|nr:helix-turn-helix domain-containing protein [Clostridia bacterium]
ENSFSISDTARAMFIHKNTLIYRIERVERLTGFRLRSFRDAMLLYMAVCIQQYGEQQE